MDGFGRPKSSAKARGQDLGRRAGSHGRPGQMMASALGPVALLRTREPPWAGVVAAATRPTELLMARHLARHHLGRNATIARIAGGTMMVIGGVLGALAATA